MAQDHRPRESLDLLCLPPELVKQIVAQVVTEKSLTLSNENWKMEQDLEVGSSWESRDKKRKENNILDLLLTNKRLSEEASKCIERIAKWGILQLHISPADKINGLDYKVLQAMILAHWEDRLRLVPWEIFCKIHVSLKPSCFQANGSRRCSLDDLFDLIEVLAPKLELVLGERVRNGECSVKVICCERDGNPASYHQSLTSEELPLPCWGPPDLGFVLEAWAWLLRSQGNCYSIIECPNMLLMTRDLELLPRKVEYWSHFLRSVWETETSSTGSGRLVSWDAFLDKNSRKFAMTIPTVADKWFLLTGAKIESAGSKGPTLARSSAAEIVCPTSPHFKEAESILEEIVQVKKGLPDPWGDIHARFVQLEADLRWKAYRSDRPDESGLEMITSKLNDFLDDLRWQLKAASG